MVSRAGALRPLTMSKGPSLPRSDGPFYTFARMFVTEPLRPCIVLSATHLTGR
jgi:hypothetical protein